MIHGGLLGEHGRHGKGGPYVDNRQSWRMYAEAALNSPPHFGFKIKYFLNLLANLAEVPWPAWGRGHLGWNFRLCADLPSSRLLSWGARYRPPRPPDLGLSMCRGVGQPSDCPSLPVCCGGRAQQSPSNPCRVPLAEPSSPPLTPTRPPPQLLTPLFLARPAPATLPAPAQAAHYSGRLLLA